MTVSARATKPATARVRRTVPEDEVGSPLWWLRRLHTAILLRRNRLQRLQRYFDGEFPLNYADENLRRAFGPVFNANRFGINWMRLVISAVEERLQVQGIRVGESKEADPAAWDLWQSSNLDELSSTAHLEALLNGISYVCVWKGENEDQPEITIEHPNAAIVEADPKNPRRRIVGLRIYADAYGVTHGELFFPDKVYLFRASTGSSNLLVDPLQLRWIVDTGLVPDGEMVNPYGTVPIIPFANPPQLLSAGVENIARRSDIWAVMPIQDAVNSLLFNTILIANAQGYRQRWVTGLEVERDAEGNPVEPFKAGIDRLFVAESPDTKFGEFSPVDITPMVRGLDMLTHAIAAVSQVPPHYFSASADRLSGESIKAAETGLVAKVHRKQVSFGESWEEVMRLAGQIAGNAALSQARGAEMMWTNAETRSEAQVADSAVKRSTVGVPWRALMEFLGYSPQQIVRMETDRASDQLTALLNAPPPSSTPAAPPVAPSVEGGGGAPEAGGMGGMG